MPLRRLPVAALALTSSLASIRGNITDIDPSDLISLATLAVAFTLCAALWHRSQDRAARVMWTLAVLVATVPIFDLHAHTHWVNVSYNPFFMLPSRMLDIAANILLYVPFGFLARPCQPLRRHLTHVAGAAALLALLAETSQLFSHSRIPSSTDVLSDVLGAVLGAFLSVRCVLVDGKEQGRLLTRNPGAPPDSRHLSSDR